MWLAILFIIFFVAGAAIAIFGGGPIGFVLAAIAVVGFFAKFAGAFGGQSPTAAEHADRGERLEHGEPTGTAHEGQKHMTPEQI
jgi:hypothetical protein